MIAAAPQTAAGLAGPVEMAAMVEGIRSAGERRHASWDDAVFVRFGASQAGALWQSLQRHGPGVPERTVASYLTVVAAGIGAGYLTANAGPPRTLLEGLLERAVPWLAGTDPARHGHIVSCLWNLADGAHREALWMERYLLAHLDQLDDPLNLAQQAAQVLGPVLAAHPDALWQGPYTVQTLHLAQALPAFLPGQMSMLTPSLVRIADRRHDRAVGVLLSPLSGQSACIGPLEGTHVGQSGQAGPDARKLPVTVRWGHDHVQVGDTRVPLPLMACEPLHTLALASGHLLAAVASSQQLWLVHCA